VRARAREEEGDVQCGGKTLHKKYKIKMQKTQRNIPAYTAAVKAFMVQIGAIQAN
jgi:hypothetical protein